MSFKLKGKNNNPLVLDTLDEDDLDVGIELKSLIVNMKREMCGVIDFFLSFLTKYNEKRTHNMLFLMLDSKYKCL